MGDVRGEIVRQAPAALAGLVVGDEHPQPRAGALGDLAELLRRPPEARAELLALHVQRDLAGQHQPLVGGQLVGELAQAADVVLPGKSFGDIARRVRDGGQDGTVGAAFLVIAVAQRGVCHGRDRATAAQRAAAISDAREEALLKRIGDVRLALERPCARARARNQLQGRLAVAVLEVLKAQAMAVHPQQHVALERRDVRHELGRVLAATLALSRHLRRAPRAPFLVVACRDQLRPGDRGRDNDRPSLVLLPAEKALDSHVTFPCAARVRSSVFGNDPTVDYDRASCVGRGGWSRDPEGLGRGSRVPGTPPTAASPRCARYAG